MCSHISCPVFAGDQNATCIYIVVYYYYLYTASGCVTKNVQNCSLGQWQCNPNMYIMYTLILNTANECITWASTLHSHP